MGMTLPMTHSLVMNEPRVKLPAPGLESRTITIDEYFENTPEKLEVIDGYLIDGPDQVEPRLRLLALLLANVGLIETVKLAPRTDWQRALDRAYGTE
jgi:hypothetical protein